MKLTYKGVLTAAALLTGVLSTPAAVTVQGWWHGGETGDYRADSSANNRPWRHGFSGCAGSGNPGGIITPNKGVGGPLGNTGYISTTSVYWLYQDCGTGGAWIPGNDAIDPHYGTTEGIYNPPATNYIIECWLLINPDVAGSGWFFASGSGDFSQPSRPAGAGGGGVYLMRNNDAGTVKIGAFVIGNAGQGVPADTQIGDYVNADSTRWMHVAIVNDGGTNTFYVNGVAHGAPQPLNTVPNGNIFLGSSPGTWNAFHGYLDELRISTFAPGAFAVSDLLLRPANPNILAQPQSVTIWDGGAAPFSVVAAFDTVSGYQWQKNGVNISGATAANVVIPQLFVADSGTSVRCLLTGPGGSSTSSNATATVVAQNPANVAAYQNLVKSEPSLLAYFPVDGDLGATLTNYKDPTRNGTLEGGASYDGRTNSAFGQRALGFNLNGDVTIPNNPAFEFSGGNGTIEALVYLSQAAPVDATIFAKANDYAGGLYYAFRMGSGGSTLNYVNDAGANLSWMTPGSLVGKFTHVALVIDHGTNVTAYANGYSLGTKTQTSFGSATGSPAWIGSSGLNDPGTNFWIGTIDELAVYGSALPADTIGIHASKFQSGTNEVPAVITGLPATGSKTLLAGGVASFTVQASGGAPMSYKWTKNGVAIPGATSRTLTLSPTALTDSGTYGVTVSNPYATTNSPTFDLIVVAPSDSYATMVMNAHPSAYWRLTETNGTVAADVAGGKDGTYQGSYALGSQALLGRNPANKSVRFNAPNANYGGKVEVPYSSVLNPPADQPFSVECFCYAYFNSNDSYGIMLSSWNAVPSSIRQGYVLSTGWGSINWDFAMFNGYNTARPTLHGGPNLLEPGLYYVAATWDGTNAYLYVNGTTTGPLVPAPYSPNPSASFVIGCRNDNGIAFDGVIGEVAFYNYALSANQLSNHWSGMFAPAVITTQPVGVTTNEGSTVTLTAAATGYPLTYQWFKDGVAIDGTTLNGDSTAHYPSGATGPTLVITQVSPTADAGSYWLQAYTPLPGGNATSTHVNVTVTADTTPPRVLGAAALGTPNTVAPYGPYLVKVWFNKRIDAYVGSYTIPGVTVISVSVPTEAGAAPVGGDWREAIITTAGLTPGQTYTVSVSGVKDQTVAQNVLVATNLTFRAPLLSQGLLEWDFYYMGGNYGGSVADLTGSQWYPNTPSTNLSASTFDSTPLTSGDANNVGFGGAGDHYGCALSGWITPKVTGNYTFFLSSDDSSELWVSTDSTPQNAALVAYQTGCCNAFTEPTNVPAPTYTSQPIPMQANVSYFIRALQVEGGGGDYVKVAWRREGDPWINAANLTPIPGTYLSSYAPGSGMFSTPVYSGGQLTLNWAGTATLMQSTNVAAPLSQWTPTPGNPVNSYTVTPAAGQPAMFYRLVQ